MKRLLLIVVILIVVLGALGGGFYAFAAKLPPAATVWIPASLRPMLNLAPIVQEAGPVKPPKPVGPPAYYDLPVILAELPVSGRGNELIRLAVSLQLGGMEDVPGVQNSGPQIRDAFQVYLRDNEIGNLERPADLKIFRREMLLRIRKIVAPTEVTEVLVREVQIQ